MSASVLEPPNPTGYASGARSAVLDVRAAGSHRAALLVAVLGFFVVTLDALVVNVALPAVGSDLGGGITGLQWVVDGYTLMFAALLLSAGALSDRIGARQAFGGGSCCSSPPRRRAGWRRSSGCWSGHGWRRGLARR